MARSLRDKYAQKNKGKVSIAGRGTVNRTSSTASGKKYSVNQKNKVKEDTKKYFTVSRAKDKDYQQSKNSWQDNTKTSTSKIGTKSTTKNLSTANLYEEGKKKQQTKNKPKSTNRQQISSGSNKGRYWTDIAGKQKTNRNITPISDPTQGGDYLFVNQAQSKTKIADDPFKKQTEQIEKDTAAKYKPARDEEIANGRTAVQNAYASNYPSFNVAGMDAMSVQDYAVKQAEDTANAKISEIDTQAKREADDKTAQVYNEAANKIENKEQAIDEGKKLQNANMTFEDKEILNNTTDKDFLNNYYAIFGKYGQQAAHKYYLANQDRLIAQYAVDIDKKEAAEYNKKLADIDSSNLDEGTKNYLKWREDFNYNLGKTGNAALAGIRNYARGIYNIPGALTGETQVASQSPIEALYSQERESMDGAWGVVADLTYSTAQNAPSIAAGAVTAGWGSMASIAATTYGNTYADYIDQGYTIQQAQSAAGLEAVNQAVMDRVFNGIHVQGEGLITKLFKNSVVDEVIAKPSNMKVFLGALKNLAKSANGEGMEEVGQDVISACIQSFITGEELNIDVGQLAYSYMLGALTALGMNGVENTFSHNQYVRQAQEKIYGEALKESNNDAALAAKRSLDTSLPLVENVGDPQAQNLAAEIRTALETGQDISNETLIQHAQDAINTLSWMCENNKLVDSFAERNNTQEQTVNERNTPTEEIPAEQSTEPQINENTVENINAQSEQLNTQLDDIESQIDELTAQKEALQERVEAGEISQTRANMQARTIDQSINNLYTQSSEIQNTIQQLQSQKPTQNAVVAENANTTQTENVAQSQQSENRIPPSRYAVYDPNKHDATMKKTIEDYNNAHNEKLYLFAENVDKGKKVKPLNVGEVSAREVQGIKEVLNRDVTGFKREINQSQMEHILNGHGKNGDADRSMSDFNDIARIEWVLNNYDNIVDLQDNTKAFAERDENGKTRPVPLVKYSKRIDGTIYVVEAVPMTSKKTIEIFDAYMQKNRDTTQRQMQDLSESPDHTSETDLSSFSNENVTQSSSDVKSELKKGDEVVHTKYKYGGTGKGKVVSIKNGKVKIKFGDSGTKAFSIKNIEDGIIKKASEIEQKPRTIEELEAADDVSTGTKATQDRRSIPEKIKDFGGWIYRGLTDTQDSVAKISTDINYQVNAVRGATSRADANIGVLPHAQNLTQTNIWGQRKEGTKTLTKIFEPINNAGKDTRVLFDKYMYHKLNISRYEAAGKAKSVLESLISNRDNTYRQYPRVKNEVEAYKSNKLSYNELSEGGKTWVNLDRKIEQLQDLARYKPVFGDDVSLEESKAFVNKYASDKLFTDTEKQLRGYLDNLVQARVDSGNISSDFANYLSGENAIYENYIPAYYSNKGMTMDSIFEDAEQDTAVGKTVSRAQGAGSGDVLMDLEDAIAKQTRAVFTEGNINLLMNNLTNQIKQNPAYKGKYSDKPFVQKNGNQSHDILYYDKGTPKHLYVSDDIFVGIDGLSKTMKSNALINVVSTVNNVFKKSITEWNPVFLARNFIKDFSDGVWYTKFGMKNFVKNWGKAAKEIANQGDYYSAYMNSGAAMGSFFSDYSGNTIEGKTRLTSNKNLLQKGVDKISMANFAVELAPRLSEFISTIEAHGMNAKNVTSDVLMEAIYNANEVTTNFGRSGAAGKYINKIVPFFNPSVQGFDKAIRQLKGENGSKFSAKRLAGVLVKGTMIGLAPAMLQEILIAALGDDDDKELYYSMSDYTKNNYYIVFTGNGSYVKIPKGRVTGIFGNVGRGIVQDVRATTSGKKYNSTDWTALWDSAVNNVAPTNPFENAFGIGIARVLIGQGKDWKGYEIESDDDQKLPVADRYDEDTTPIAMWLSRNLGLANLGLSPKKIDVLIDEQGGVFGDIALPLSQRMSTGDINGVADIGKMLLDVSGFTGNAYESNARSGQVYNLKNELETQINHDNLVNGESNIKSVDQLVLDFINDTQGSVYDNKDKIAQAKISGDMSQDDIQKLNRELSKENTEINTAILANIDGFREKVSKYYDKYITDNMTEEQKKQGVKTAYLQAYAETLGADLAVKNTLSDDSYSEYKQTGASADGYYKYLVGSYGLSAASENGKATEADKKTMLNSLGLNNKDIKGIWQTEFEDKNTNEKRTIAYAEKIGVSPKNFLQWQVQYANTKGDVDNESTPSESLYYENGKLAREEDNPGTVSGSKKQKDCQNLLNSGYSDKEKDYFFQMAYGSDNKYAQARADGINPDAYLQYMADGTNNLKADKDEDGNSISGSKKAKVLKYIANMDITDEQKIYFATEIAGYKIDGISSIMQYAEYSGGSTGSGSGGRKRSGSRGRSSGSSASSSPKKLAQALLAIQKKSRTKPTATSNGLKSLALSLGKQDTIKQNTKAQELLAIDNNPLYTSAMKNKLKQSINARYS